ncbi:hypothetical protein DX932_31605 [Bacillus cereus]|uniref:Uncharacterized protein n=1 Tax=Bacillus cereus TaxID=1396 RepID=A0A9W7PZ04_BACCE|nr:hypothetical protein DX932_31605 [Bacillus cereus]PEQ70031.1 hypothetical protein CN474_17835 [Bacillus thuringiensis]
MLWPICMSMITIGIIFSILTFRTVKKELRINTIKKFMNKTNYLWVGMIIVILLIYYFNLQISITLFYVLQSILGIWTILSVVLYTKKLFKSEIQLQNCFDASVSLIFTGISMLLVAL